MARGGPDLRKGRGPPLFLHASVAASSPRLKPLRPLIPHSYSQPVRRFLSAIPCSLVSPHDHQSECRWRYLWKLSAPLPPGRGGGSKKKGLFSSAKKPSRRPVPATMPKTGGSGGSFLPGGLSRPRWILFERGIREWGRGAARKMPSVGGDGGQRGEEPV